MIACVVGEYKVESTVKGMDAMYKDKRLGQVMGGGREMLRDGSFIFITQTQTRLLKG
jgi:hypothetical protein